MPCDYHLLPHEGIRSLAPYIPGKSTEELREEQGIVDIIKMASNENPLGCSPLVTEALGAVSSTQIATYPQYANDPLRKKLADKFSVSPDMIMLGNGTDSLFTLLQTCFALHCDKHIITHQYGFSTYSIQAQTLGIPVVTTGLLADWQVDIDGMIAACNDKTALIFLANPNNPTGSYIHSANIKKLLQHIPVTTLLVLDEAYYEFIDPIEKINSLKLLEQHTNLVITRTFSKAYGLAALRVGYAISDASITALLQRVQLPFAINKAALVGANAALDDQEFINSTLANNKQGLKQLQQGLDKLRLKYLPIEGNFITFDCRRDAIPLYQALLRHGVIVRPLNPYGLNHYLRVSVGTPPQNSRFLNTLERLYNEK